MKNYSKASIIISACLMIAVGIVVLFNPRATLVSLSMIIGVFMLVSGVLSMIFYFSAARGALGAGTVLFAGVSDLVIGLMFLNHGWFIAEILTFAVGLWLTVFGVERFIRAFDLKKLGYSNWWLTLIIGAACAVLGALSMLTPLTGAILVSVVVGVGFIAYGVAQLVILHIIKNADGNIVHFE